MGTVAAADRGQELRRLQVVLVEDEALMRNGLKLLLGNAVEVVGEARNGREGVQVVLDSLPDVVLMDIRMPVMDGIEAVKKILSARQVPIIMLTAFDTDEFIVGALRAGAAGFLLKTTPKEALLSAIHAAAAGQPIVSPEVLGRLVEQHPVREASPSSLAALSEREREIAELVAEGLDNQEIAERAFVSVTTVKSHIKSILRKIGGTSRVHIAIAVLESR